MLSKKQISIAFLSSIIGVSSLSLALAQNAGDVMNKMSPEQRVGYIDGVIEGLAYSRWLREKPDSTGMKCIYDWYYQAPNKNWNKITAWLNRHPDKPVGGLLHVLIKRDCGE